MRALSSIYLIFNRESGMRYLSVSSVVLRLWLALRLVGPEPAGPPFGPSSAMPLPTPLISIYGYTS